MGIHDPEYLALGDAASRLENYRALFVAHVDDGLVTGIRRVTDRGLALGDSRFIGEMERLTGRALRPGRMGRPAKERRDDDPVGSLF